MKKVVLFNCEDQTDAELEHALAAGSGTELMLANDRRDEELAELCAEADGIITIYAPLPRRVLERLPRCKAVVVQAIGYDNVDLAAASELGICVANVPDACVYDVAAHTVALALACARRIVPLDRRVRSGGWGYAGFENMRRVRGQRFGFVAFGKIPRVAAPMLRALGMELAAYAPTVADEVLAEHGVERAHTLEELLTQADFVSLHCPLRPGNVGLIGARELALMKPEAFLINTARGAVVDEAALLAALKNGAIQGAALDVLAAEGAGANPLYALENVIFTPHTAFYSVETLAEVRRGAMEQVLAVLRDGEAPTNLLNPEVLGHARFRQEKLGQR